MASVGPRRFDRFPKFGSFKHEGELSKMSNLIQFSESYQAGSGIVPSSSGRRLERSVGNALDQLGARQVIDVARLRAVEALQVERVHAVQNIANEGVMAAAHVMSRARMLMDRNPMDAGIIQSMAQLGCMDLANVVSSSGRRLS